MNCKKDRLYIAYGSNLNLRQMENRCPTAENLGAAVLSGWQLRFRGSLKHAVATIEKAEGCTVPVLVWKLQPRDEYALDRYEGFPHLYRKEMLQVILGKEQVSAMAYIMNEPGNPYGIPSPHYLNTIFEGYKTAGFNVTPLVEAANNTPVKEDMTND